MIGTGLCKRDGALEILALGAHCDDIEIGCGGSILQLLKCDSTARITWVVLTSNEKRKSEAEAGARLFAGNAANIEILIYDFPDGFLPHQGSEVKNCMEDIKRLVDPDLIFTHYRHDLHQDHRFISELTWNTFRNHLILEYEIPKWDGDIGNPNTFVHLDKDTAKEKISHVMSAYPSQQSKPWFSEDLFMSMMRIRGMESNSPDGLAEGFYGRKTVLDLNNPV